MKIDKRLNAIEEKISKGKKIPIILVREEPEEVFTITSKEYKGKVIKGKDALIDFAKQHSSIIINNNIPKQDIEMTYDEDETKNDRNLIE